MSTKLIEALCDKHIIKKLGYPEPDQSTQYTYREAEKEGESEVAAVAKLGLKSVSKIIMDYKGQYFPVYLYEDDKQWQPWIDRTNLKIKQQDKIKVAIQPEKVEIIIKTNDERDLWEKLLQLKLPSPDTNEIYENLRNKIYNYENPTYTYKPHKEVDL